MDIVIIAFTIYWVDKGGIRPWFKPAKNWTVDNFRFRRIRET
jgi:hypothetical protein